MAQVLRFISNTEDEDDTLSLDSESYLRAATEALGILFFGSSLLAFVFDPEIFDDNPVKDMLGYNNIAVALQRQLGNIWAHFWYPFVAYFALRYLAEDTRRTAMGGVVRGRNSGLLVWANRLHALSLVIINCTVIGITPRAGKDWTTIVHLLGYILTMASGNIVAAASSYKFGTNRAVYWTGAYSLATSVLCVWYSVIAFGTRAPTGPTAILAALDWMWAVSTVASSIFVVRGPLITGKLELDQ